MKNFLWLIIGVGAGFVVAHQVNKTPQGGRFFSDVDSRAKEFGDAVSDGYRKREAELRAAIDEAQDTITQLSNQ